jgi:hypothetical protein
MGVSESFTIETSFCGVSIGKMAPYLYDEQSWKDIGGKICEGIYHLLTTDMSKIRSVAERELKIPAEKRVMPSMGMKLGCARADSWRELDVCGSQPVISKPKLTKGTMGKTMVLGPCQKVLIGPRNNVLAPFLLRNST